MFKIVNKEFHVTRGDYGIIDFYVPITDENNYLNYRDNDDNDFWYDSENKILYDSSYERSTTDIKTLTLQLHTFNKGDVVRFKVFKKKDCGCVEIQKDITVSEQTTHIDIELTSDDTKIGELINKPVDYWYEVELNPDTKPQTVIGYDEAGEKIFKLYPEGNDKQ